MPAERVALAVFARAPIAGQVKTRLARVLGDQAAVRLYAAFLQDSLRLANSIAGAEVSIWAASAADLGPLQAQYGPCRLQPPGDLGARMQAALAEGIAQCGRAAVLGSDAPTLPSEHLRAALDALQDHDAVLGPAHDGGYWLLGARVVPDLRGVRWSSEHALTDTQHCLRAYRTWLAAPWHDVDVVEDLDLLRRDLAERPNAAPSTRAVLESSTRILT